MYMWGAPSGDTVVLLGDFSYHMVIDSKTSRPVIGMNRSETNVMFCYCIFVQKGKLRCGRRSVMPLKRTFDLP